MFFWNDMLSDIYIIVVFEHIWYNPQYSPVYFGYILLNRSCSYIANWYNPYLTWLYYVVAPSVQQVRVWCPYLVFVYVVSSILVSRYVDWLSSGWCIHIHFITAGLSKTPSDGGAISRLIIYESWFLNNIFWIANCGLPFVMYCRRVNVKCDDGCDPPHLDRRSEIERLPYVLVMEMSTPKSNCYRKFGMVLKK